MRSIRPLSDIRDTRLFVARGPVPRERSRISVARGPVPRERSRISVARGPVPRVRSLINSSDAHFSVARGPVPRVRSLIAALLLSWLSLSGCEKPTWTNSLDSPVQIGMAVVDALNRKDIAKLNQLRVQREAYLAWLWSAFPASQPPSNFPGDFAWENLNKKCNIGMKRALARYGGHNLTFVDIRFDKPMETYDGFQLLRGTVLTLRNAEGKKMELKILGSVVVKNQRYKLLSYQD